MTREDGIIDTIATVAALLASGMLADGNMAVVDHAQVVRLAVDIYKRSRQAVKELQAEGNYAPLAGAKEAQS